MKLRFWIPLAYSVAGLCLVFGFGGAGHGWGGEAFFYLSWPAALLVENTKEIVLWCLVVGNVQWAIVGYIAERLLWRRTSKPPASRQKV